MSNTALHINNLRFTYPARRKQPAHEAVRGVSLDIPQGQTVALLGPNGSGKSTLLHSICGMLPLQANSGSLAVFDHQQMNDIRRVIGVVFQSPALDRHMTVDENLRDQAALYGIPGAEARTIIERELAAAGLGDRQKSLVKTLSKGLARRVDLIRAMLHKPRLLLLDEPTVGLDPTARERFIENLLQQRASHDLTVVLSTHLVDEADRMDRVVLMHEGKIVADDSPSNLRRLAGALRITVHDVQWSPPASMQSRFAWQQSISSAWVLTLDNKTDDAQHIAAHLAGENISFSIAPPTLADVFEQLTGGRLSDAGQPFETAEAHQ